MAGLSSSSNRSIPCGSLWASPSLRHSSYNNDTALIRFQAIPGSHPQRKVVRSGFSLNPSTRTLQTEIDIPNPDGHLHPGWYVTVTIAIDHKRVLDAPFQRDRVPGRAELLCVPPGRRQTGPHAGHHRPLG